MLTFIAQTVSDPNWIPVITQTGAVGAISFFMIRWFMGRNDSALASIVNELREVQNSNHRLARAQLLLVIALNQANATSKETAREGILEIDAEMKKNKTGN